MHQYGFNKLAYVCGSAGLVLAAVCAHDGLAVGAHVLGAVRQRALRAHGADLLCSVQQAVLRPGRRRPATGLHVACEVGILLLQVPAADDMQS